MSLRTKELYSFDSVFGSEATTKQIFDEQVKGLVLNSLKGINQTIFAYGQTSSGKTFTMRGPSEQQLKFVVPEQSMGLIPLSIKEIFDYVKADIQRKYKITVQYLEVSLLTL